MEDHQNKILELVKLTNKSFHVCADTYLKSGEDLEKALKLLLKSEKKNEKKKFKIGDIVVCTNNGGDLPKECLEYLKTYKYFKVLNINDNLNIDIGCVKSNGKKFSFNPNRFELKNNHTENNIYEYI